MNPRLFVLMFGLFILAMGGACAAPPTPDTAPGPTTAVVTAALTPTPDPYLNARLRMVEETMRRRGLKDERVLKVMEKVPRHEFVLPQYLPEAYADHPLPIGYGQTISQPYIVALMTELLQLEPHDKVLEIGTGSGYQAAVLAELVDEVWTIEIIPELAQSAAERLQRLGYTNVHIRTADGYYGWPEEQPFDAIIVTAAPDHIPQPLLAQLADGGVMVVPVGPPGGYQTLWQLIKTGDEVKAFNMGGVAFVPLVGGGQRGRGGQ
ncbi:MAG: protein-L-isoaspartate(D-aspartate) O-methyltransferase [Anaerolineae bacterium]|nr:protein-L-isoaspartate(D-aspartate) O-methyltransferase [Caldilineales bacterium]MCX7851265.1 protein-L-isoaspartate(D-aspartate) O-methyltransferase [Caldilineales bacterium]MDW8270662.1 protein-L-isoaspartate(D-aspartate) O-methyltransferase [Anaerolineae bacterium]